MPSRTFHFKIAGCLTVAALLASTLPAWAQLRPDKPELLRVHERVYCAHGYALGNVIFVLTDESVVVVDTTENPRVAEKILQDFRAISQLPVRTIIYTHFHGDHVNGATAFHQPGTRVIAQSLHVPEMLKYRQLAGYNSRLNSIQWGSMLPEAERGIVLSLDLRRLILGYVPPDVTFDDEHRFTEGNVRFELYHAQGETVDHLKVWLPDLKVLLVGDLYYPCFPMLASPMKPDRPALLWAESVEGFRAHHAEHLVPSHGPPVHGVEVIDALCTNYARAIRHVHDETIKRLNTGKSLEQIRAEVRLPEDLASLPYLQPLYGQVAWAVNGVYRQSTGWYGMNPAHLNPGPTAALHTALVEAAGSPEAICRRAQAAAETGNWQLALELADIVLSAAPEHQPARQLAIEALEHLAAAAINPVEQNIYRGAAHEHRQRLK